MKKEQREVIDKFEESYSERGILKKNISLGDFISKDKLQQEEVIKNWAKAKHSELGELEHNLKEQQKRITKEKDTLKQALRGWGIIV